jgi:succinate-semialdehyde dehydrogenase/glutarate-semialdehyde dehydrogenase
MIEAPARPAQNPPLDHPLRLARADLLRTRALIDGRWVEAAHGAVFAVTDPATGATIAEVADSDPAMAGQAVEAAVAAFGPWRDLTAKARSALLRAWFDLVIANGEDLARLMSWEQGKPVAEARGEVAYAAGYLEWFAEEAKRAYGDIIPTPVAGRELMVFKEPVGVVAVITPWNFPMAMIARKFAPALAAGCTVVAKPAGETPLSALALAVLAQEAGIPPGVLNVLPTARTREVAEVWMRDPRVRKVSFTGSTGVGKLLARQGAETMKRMSLELGGDAPLIVFEDADLDVALGGLMKAKFRNTGQACIAANRVYVHADIYEAFSARIVAAVRALTVGAAADGPADIGPLINPRAAAAMADLVQDAVGQGARVLAGGRAHALGGNFFEPTVLADVKPGMKACREEIFGPIVALTPFTSEDEVIAAANNTPYGLAAYLFSTDLKRIWRVMRRLESGLVGVNEGAVSTEVAPFGGVKESGYGREGSQYGLADYQNLKYVCLGDLN